MTPKVSVIIGTHNHAHFLPECLASVKQQSYPDFEIIVVDNGSTDNTKEVIEQLGCDKIRYHYQENTGSVAGSRNTGIKLAKGKYVSFLDSDDLWYKDKLAKTMATLTADSSIDIISHDLLRRVCGKEDRVMKVGPASEDMLRQLLLENRLLGSATTVKTNLMRQIGGFDSKIDYKHAEDYETWLRIAELDKKFAFINETLGEYREHGTNLSYDFEATFNHEANVISKHFKNYKGKNKLWLWTAMLSKIYFKLAFKLCQNRQFLKGIFYTAKAFCYNPGYFLKNRLKGLARRFRGGI